MASINLCAQPNTHAHHIQGEAHVHTWKELEAIRFSHIPPQPLQCPPELTASRTGNNDDTTQFSDFGEVKLTLQLNHSKKKPTSETAKYSRNQMMSKSELCAPPRE